MLVNQLIIGFIENPKFYPQENSGLFVKGSFRFGSLVLSFLISFYEDQQNIDSTKNQFFNWIFKFDKNSKYIKPVLFQIIERFMQFQV